MDDVLLVRPEAPVEQTEAGVVIPRASQQVSTRGVVVVAGPGRLLDNGQRVALQVKVGDRVAYQDYSGKPFEHEGVDHLLLRECEVLAVVEDD